MRKQLTDPIRIQSVLALFGTFYGKRLIKFLEDCCNSDDKLGNLQHLRFVGDDTTTDFTIPKNKHLAFISTDGRVNDPLTEFTYNSSTGLISFIGAPSLDVVILIFFQ